MLHYFVVCTNTKGEYGEATEEGYYKKLTDAFKKLRGEVWLLVLCFVMKMIVLPVLSLFYCSHINWCTSFLLAILVTINFDPPRLWECNIFRIHKPDNLVDCSPALGVLYFRYFEFQLSVYQILFKDCIKISFTLFISYLVTFPQLSREFCVLYWSPLKYKIKKELRVLLEDGRYRVEFL